LIFAWLLIIHFILVDIHIFVYMIQVMLFYDRILTFIL